MKKIENHAVTSWAQPLICVSGKGQQIRDYWSQMLSAKPVFNWYLPIILVEQ